MADCQYVAGGSECEIRARDDRRQHAPPAVGPATRRRHAAVDRIGIADRTGRTIGLAVDRRTAGVVTLAALVLVLLALAVGLRILRPVSCPDQPEWWMVGC